MKITIDLDLLFENFVRNYGSFGFNQSCTWTRHTTEYMSWFAKEGMGRGFHVDQEVEYPEPPEIGAQKKRRADLVWITDPDRPLKDEVFALHVESETGEKWGELTVSLLAYSPFKPLPAVVGVLHKTTQRKSKRAFARSIVKYASKRLKNRNREMLLILDLFWEEGDPIYGCIIDRRGSVRIHLAEGLYHKWRKEKYYDLKLVGQVKKFE